MLLRFPSSYSVQHQEAGTRAFKLGDWQTAVSEYTKAIALEPQTPLHYSNRSAAYVKLGRFHEAAADADACIRIQPTYCKGYGRKGSALIAMKEYDQAIDAYTKGLQVAPDEESLRMGLEAARYAQRENSQAQRAVRRTRAARLSSVATQHKAQHATTASSFVAEKRRQIKLEMAALQAQLDLLAELEEMSDDAKIEMLFSLIDKKRDGMVDAAELANALRAGNKSLSLSDAIDRAIRTVAAFDKDGDTKLDMAEFKTCIEATRDELDMTLGEFAEFMSLQLALVEDLGIADMPTSATPMVSDSASSASLEREVSQEEEYMKILRDPRMQELFHLFDKDGNMELSFKQVASGLYRLSHNMAESTRTTMGVLFMLDKHDKRTLDYEQFGRLVLAVVAASTAPFDQVVDDLIFALTADDPIPESELQALYVADNMYEGVLDLKQKQHEVSHLMDPVIYGRIQKLFDTWDINNDGYISKKELAIGLRHFHEASHEEGDPEEEATSLIELDQDGDHLLDRLDFARALGTFAEEAGKSLHDMIDFMVVTTAIGEKQTNSYKRAFRHSVSMDAAAMALRDIKNLDVDD